jgi:hypothetical protein
MKSADGDTPVSTCDLKHSGEANTSSSSSSSSPIHYLVADVRCSFQSVFLDLRPSANYENVMII